MPDGIYFWAVGPVQDPSLSLLEYREDKSEDREVTQGFSVRIGCGLSLFTEPRDQESGVASDEQIILSAAEELIPVCCFLLMTVL